MKNKQRVCPVEMSGSLDNRVRRWFQNPQKILQPYIEEGMAVLEIGCGPGFFTLDMARMVGQSGRVIAVDMQEGMLEKLKSKIAGTDLERRIEPHKCEVDRIGISETVDFILLFYVAHEIPDKSGLFRELYPLLCGDGQILIVEPPFHVSKAAFEQMLKQAEEAGFVHAKSPKMLLHKTAILQK